MYVSDDGVSGSAMATTSATMAGRYKVGKTQNQAENIPLFLRRNYGDPALQVCLSEPCRMPVILNTLVIGLSTAPPGTSSTASPRTHTFSGRGPFFPVSRCWAT